MKRNEIHWIMRTSEQVFFEMLVIGETMVQQGEMKWNKLKDNEMINHISCPLRCRFVGWGYYVPSRWDKINFTINNKVCVTGARWVGCSNRVRWTWDKLNEIIRTDALWGVSYGSGHELPRWDKVRWLVRTGAHVRCRLCELPCTTRVTTELAVPYELLALQM